MKAKGLPIVMQRLKYVTSDLVTTAIAFLLFDVARFYILHEEFLTSPSLVAYLTAPKLIWEQILIPVALLFVYWLSGYYNRPYEKSRLNEFITTFYSALFNAALIFLILLINDRGPIVSSDYLLICISFLLLLGLTYIGRLIITASTRRHAIKNNIRHNVIIVGDSFNGHDIYRKLISAKTLMKYNVVGFIRIKQEKQNFQTGLPCWELNEIEEVCQRESIDQVILAPDNEKDSLVLEMLDRLFPLGIPIKIMPDTLSYVTSSIRMTDIMAEPFIDLTSPPLNDCSNNIKLTFDIIMSVCVLLILSPIMVALMIAVKLSSPGPVFYHQERIGKKRKPFKIYKFRSMYVDAESNGPMLSSSEDKRVTPLGKVLRKYRLDELPQFWNVLKGDMSLVGPRPERDFFIRKIIERAPYYCLVFQVKPGITSWGMVKYGYASNIDQMVNRTKFDLIYITNMSIALDIKILIYTIRTIIRGSGV